MIWFLQLAWYWEVLIIIGTLIVIIYGTKIMGFDFLELILEIFSALL